MSCSKNRSEVREGQVWALLDALTEALCRLESLGIPYNNLSPCNVFVVAADMPGSSVPPPLSANLKYKLHFTTDMPPAFEVMRTHPDMAFPFIMSPE